MVEADYYQLGQGREPIEYRPIVLQQPRTAAAVIVVDLSWIVGQLCFVAAAIYDENIGAVVSCPSSRPWLIS